MENRAMLFDFDGVVVDTEKYYTIFWDSIGEKYLGQKDFCAKVKGTTLTSILASHFSDMKDRWDEIVAELNAFEEKMPIEYIPGVVDFVKEVRRRGFRTAVVTSSNRVKMETVYRKRPEIRELFDVILTSEDFSASKPDPDCFIKGMERLKADREHTIVFEDSVYGLQAAKASGALVVGLTTTNPRDVVAKYSRIQIPDFTNPAPIFSQIKPMFFIEINR